MKKTLLKIKESLSKRFVDDEDEDFEDSEEPQNYLEIESYKENSAQKNNKIMVRKYTVEDFQDVKEVLDAVREGYTIALVNIKPIRDKDVIELKRTINKLKKTIEAIDGDIAGIDEDWIVATPQFAKVFRQSEAKSTDSSSDFEEF